MAIQLPPLPWSEDALEPHISAKTISFHYGKHHNAYVTKLNDAIKGTPLAEKSLEELIEASAGDSAKTAVFNNAAQTWNHTFFWKSMKPKGGGEPTGKIKAAIDGSFGSFAKLKEELATKATTLFGSGWVWLVAKGGKLEVVQTKDAANPITDGKTPLVTLDVWEHAYYLDYQNRRPDFIKAFLDNLVDWDFAAKNLK